VFDLGQVLGADPVHLVTRLVLAALSVFGTGTGWPDIIVASVMAALSLWGAGQIINHAWNELRTGEGKMLSSAPAGGIGMTMLGHDHHDHDHDHDHAGHNHGPGGHQHHAPLAGFDGAFVSLARFDLPKRGPATAFPSNMAIQSPLFTSILESCSKSRPLISKGFCCTNQVRIATGFAARTGGDRLMMRALCGALIPATRAADEVDDREHDRHFHQHADDR
jgi:hypothetical protein